LLCVPCVYCLRIKLNLLVVVVGGGGDAGGVVVAAVVVVVFVGNVVVVVVVLTISVVVLVGLFQMYTGVTMTIFSTKPEASFQQLRLPTMLMLSLTSMRLATRETSSYQQLIRSATMAAAPTLAR
jgi:hypothetical protein